MAGDVEDFLRRAAQRRVANAAAKAEEKARQEKQSRPISVEYTNRNRERAATVVEPDDEVVVATLAPQNQGSALNRSLASTQVSAAIELADDRMNAHIHEKFDQEVGNFDSSRGFAGGEPNTMSNDPKDPPLTAALRKMLSSGSGLRNAILAREILDRPTHRW